METMHKPTTQNHWKYFVEFIKFVEFTIFPNTFTESNGYYGVFHQPVHHIMLLNIFNKYFSQ